MFRVQERKKKDNPFDSKAITRLLAGFARACEVRYRHLTGKSTVQHCAVVIIQAYYCNSSLALD